MEERENMVETEELINFYKNQKEAYQEEYDEKVKNKPHYTDSFVLTKSCVSVWKSMKYIPKIWQSDKSFKGVAKGVFLSLGLTIASIASCLVFPAFLLVESVVGLYPYNKAMKNYKANLKYIKQDIEKCEAQIECCTNKKEEKETKEEVVEKESSTKKERKSKKQIKAETESEVKSM